MDLSSHPQRVAVCPSAGIGHLTPFLRLASMLATTSATTSGGYKVTLVIIRPCLSSAEADQITTFLSTHPHITSFDFHLPSDDVIPTTTTPIDPFLRQYDAVSRSAHHLVHHLSTLSPPLFAVFSDLLLASGLNQPLAALGLPNFTVITTSVRFLSFMASLPYTTDFGQLNIPERDIPPPFLDPTHVFHRLIVRNCRCLKYAKGILLNSFNFFEPKSVLSFQIGKIGSDNLPPIYPIGPLWPLKAIEGTYPHWLDKQPEKSVVYLSFGSRTALSKDQIREVGKGLEKSGIRFLWVIKTTIVDKEDEGEVSELLGEGFLERTRDRGLVVKGWVSQDAVLAHPSIGGFVTHCGWNSIMEATQRGIPLLAWPQHGDQRVNAGVVEEAGLGVWESGWGWGGERVVNGEEIARRIEEMMTSEILRESARRVGEEARKAWEVDGSSSQMFKRIVDHVRGKWQAK